mgnify:CR=1 FL=1
MIEHSSCPVCKSNNISLYLTVESYRIEGDFFGVFKCGNCTHQFTNPIPDTTGVSKYYKADNYISSLEDQIKEVKESKTLGGRIKYVE